MTKIDEKRNNGKNKPENSDKAFDILKAPVKIQELYAIGDQAVGLELLSAGQALQKYESPYMNQTKPIQIAELTLHPDECKVVRKGKIIRLRKKEYQLLEFLARNKNKVISRNVLLEYVWNYSIHSITNTLEVHISNLRRKIEGNSGKKMLHTIYGLGYKLCEKPNTMD